MAAITAYTISHWGTTQAETYLDGLEECIDRCAARPYIGKGRPDIAASVQCFPFQSHIIYYIKIEDGIVVLRILHERQDLHRHLP